MTGQDLKKSILQLAIQGKLVEQKEEEGTAGELIEDIKAEKERLIKEKKIRREKLLSEISEDEIPFDIPESWEWVRLREIGITQTGNTPSRSKPEYFGNHIPFISPGDILNGYINYKNNGLSKSGKEVGRVSKKQSILQVCIGGSIGKCAVNLMEVSYNQQINAITPLICDYKFIYYLLDSRFFLLSMYDKSTGTATPIVNKSSWESIVVPFPPLEEQKRIVEKIEELMPYVDNYGGAHIKLEELNKNFPANMQKSILQYAIQGKLVEQREDEGSAEELYKEIQEEKEKLIKEGKIRRTKALAEISEDEIPFDIPESWKWVRLGDITNYGELQTIKPKDISDDNWVLELQDIQKDTSLLLDKILNRDRKVKSTKNIFNTGDVLYGKLRPYLKKVIVADESGVCSTEIIPFKGYKGILPDFIVLFLKAPVIDQIINNITHGMDMPRLGKQSARNLLFPLPPEKEQKRILNEVEKLLTLYTSLIKILE